MKHLKPVVLAFIALAASALLVLAGCSSSAPAPAATSAPAKAAEATKPAAAPAATTAPAAGAATAAPAAAGKAIAVKIGLSAPLSGDVKTFGESTKNAFDLAVDEANKAGKVAITTAVVDDKGDPTEGVNGATKLINQDKVNAIIGSVTSKVTIPVSEVAQSNKVVMITSTSTNPKVTVDGKRKDFVFRACFIDPFQGTVMSKFATTTLKAKTAAVVYDVSNDYTKGLAEFFKAAFEKSGGKVVQFDSYGKDDVDFSAILTKTASLNPDVLFLPDYYNKVNLLAKQAREKGVKAPLLGGDGWDSPELDTKAVEGGYFSNHYSPEDTRAEVQDWVKKYQAKYNVVPDALATLGYDATNLLINSVVTAGSNDTAKIRDAMAATKGFKAVSGSITFDQNGDPVKSAAVIQIKDGKQKFAEAVNP